MVEALGGLPEAERAAVVEHIKSLARMSAERRGAILTLTKPDV